MKEPIVYLPDQIDIGHGDITYLRSQDVYTALDAAGVKWVQESPEELKIRMMSLQIEELKDVCTKLQDENLAYRRDMVSLEELKKLCTDLQSQLKMARDCNSTLETKLRRFEGMEKGYTQLLGDLKEAQAENGSLAGLLGDAQKQVDELYAKDEKLKRAYLELHDQNEALKMTCSRKDEDIKVLKAELRRIMECDK